MLQDEQDRLQDAQDRLKNEPDRLQEERICISYRYPVSAEETYTSASKKVSWRTKKNIRENTNFFQVLCEYHIKFSQQFSKKSCLALSGLRSSSLR